MQANSVPLVSIVCPVFNPDNSFLKALMHSINQQSYPNIELIISDDGTSDWIQEMCQEELRVPFTYVRSGAEKGIFANLNNAISFAKGNFLQIFCQDDIMFPDLIAQQYRALSMHSNAALVFSQLKVIDNNGNISDLESRYDMRKTWPELIPQSKATNYLFTYGCMPGNLSPVMLRRSAYDAIGPFNQGYPYTGDFEYWSRAAKLFDFVYISTPLLAIRRHGMQASKQIGFKTMLNDQLRIYRDLYRTNSIQRSEKYKRWYVNQEIGVQHVYRILRRSPSLLRDSFVRSTMNQQPFNMIKSFILLLISLNGRIKWFKITPKHL